MPLIPLAAERARLGSFTGVRVVAPLVLVAIGLLVTDNPYFVHLATAGLLAYILAVSFNLIYGYAGSFNMAHVAIYGLGAFTSVYLETHTPLGFGFSLAAAVLVTTALSVLVAAPSRRLGEIFLAIQTLAFALALAQLLVNWADFSGGSNGLYAIPSPEVGDTPLLGGEPSYYWLTAAAAWLVFELMTRIHRSAMRRKFTALRETPRILSSVGLSPSKTRLLAYAVSGALAGFAGGLFAHFQLVIDLDTFSFGRLIALLLAVILGGAGYFWGPVFGVLALLLMDELSLATSAAQDLIYGVGILLLVILTRGGIAGALASLRSRFSSQRRSAPPRAVDSRTGALSQARPGPSADPDLAGAAASGVRGPDRARALDFHEVTVQFGGNTAVDGASMTVSTGEVVGLIGPNGAGKTTLINAATGDAVVTSGAVTLDSEDLLGRRPHEVVNLGIGRTFQSPKVIPDLTLVENVMLGADGRARSGALSQMLYLRKAQADDRRARARALEILDDFALGGAADELAGSQPYGVLRMVEIARNLMMDPAFLLFDEPGAGLTEFEREEVAKIVRSLSQRGLGILLVDHNLPLISSACDRIYVLQTGRVIAAGEPVDVFRQDNVIAAYLGGAR